jgi:hypothetical protein
MTNQSAIDPQFINITCGIIGTLFSALIIVIVWIGRGVISKVDKVHISAITLTTTMENFTRELTEVKDELKEVSNIKENNIRMNASINHVETQLSEFKQIVINTSSVLHEIQTHLIKYFITKKPARKTVNG